MKSKAALLTEYLKNISFMWPFVSAAALVCGLLSSGNGLSPLPILAAAMTAAGLCLAGRSFNYLILFVIGIGFFGLGMHYQAEGRQIEEEILEPMEFGFIKCQGRIEKVRKGRFSTLLTVSTPCRIRGKSAHTALILDINRRYAENKVFEAGMIISCQGQLRRLGRSAPLFRGEGAAFKIKVKRLTVEAGPKLTLAGACRRYLAARAEQSFNGETSAVVLGLVLGQCDRLSPAQRELFAKAGISHIFAASGFHINLIAGAALLICLKLRINKRAAVIIILPVCAFYSLLAGGSPSVRRALLMLALLSGALLTGRPKQPLRLIFAAALFILLRSPALVYSLSFQLSFAAVLGIALWFRPCLKIMPFKISCVSEALSLTLSVLITTAPILAAAFGYLAPASIPASLLTAPAVYLILLTAAPILAVKLPFYFACPLVFLTEASVRALTRVCGILIVLFKPVEISSLSTTLCIIYYTALLICKLILFLSSEN